VDAVAAGMLNQKAGQTSIVTRLQKLPLRLINRAALASVAIGLLSLILLGQNSNETPAADDPGSQTRVELEPTVIAVTPETTNEPIVVEPEFEPVPAVPESTEPVGEASPEQSATTIKLLSETDTPPNPVFAASHDMTISGSVKKSAEALTPEKPKLEKPKPENIAAKKVEPKTIKPKEIARVAPAPPAKPRPPTRSETWFLEQSPSTYTIQLLATYDIVELSRYAQSNKIESRTTLFETSRNARRWYVLTYGLYSSAEEARGVAAKLPTALRRNNPWIRSTESVQQAIGRRRP